MNEAAVGVIGTARRLGEDVLAWVGPMIAATAAILLVVWLADRALERRVSASVRLFLYGAVLARLALPVDWHSPLGLLGLGSRAAGGQVSLDGDMVMVQLGSAEGTPALGAAGWAALLYAAVVLVLLGRWVHVRWRLQRRLRECQTVRAVGTDGVTVLRHEELGPFVTGLLRPRIVIPGRLLDGGDSDGGPAAPDGGALAWVLRHELAHVRRRDPVASALVQVACILAWPILPAWIAARRIRALMEVACDESAVTGADRSARRRYAEVLLLLAEAAPSTGGLTPALRFGSPLHGRLRALAAWRRWPVAVQGAVVAALVTVVVACAGEPPPDELALTDAAPEGAALTARPPRNPEGLYGLKGPASFPSREVPASGPQFRLLGEKLRLEGGQGGDPVAGASRREVVGQNGRADRSEPTFTPVQPAILTITKEGGLYLGKRRVERANLREEIRRELERAGSDTLLFRGDKAVMLNTAVDLMAESKLAGARNIGILTPSLEASATAVSIATAPPAVENLPGAGTTAASRSLTGEAIPGAASVRGSMDKEIIRRTIRRHIDEAKECYERQLAKKPELSGRIAVKFTIGQTGAVEEAVLQNTTMNDPRVESCVVQAVRTWKFPEPEGGGTVIVTYPFSFTPHGGGEAIGPRAASTPAPSVPELAPNVVARTIRGRMPEIKRCYEQYLREGNGQGGRMNLGFRVQKSGAVEGVRFTHNDFLDTSMASCVLQVVRGIQFPENPSGPTEVEFPFVFSK